MRKEFLKMPIAGELIPLHEIKNEIFANGTLGPGFGMLFTGNKLVSPFDGTVLACYPQGHAFIIRRDDGLEVMLHVGLQNSKDRSAFSSKIEKYQKVKTGDVLSTFDPNSFKDDERCAQVVFSDPQTEVIILNPHSKISELDDKTVKIIID